MEVELPDGTILEFPAGTSEDVMRAAIQRYTARAGVGADGKTAAERIALAKAGKLTISPERAAKQEEINLAAEQAMRDPGAFNSFMFGGAQGVTLGFADELIGGVSAAASGAGDMMSGNFSGITGRMGESYASARDTSRNLTENARFSRPWTTFSGEVTGGILPGMAGYKAAELGMKATMPGVSAASLPARVGLGGMTGATEGAIYGAGNANGEDMLESIKNGALIGLGAGMAGPVAVTGLGAAIKAPVNALRSAFNVPSKTKAASAIEKMMRRAGMTADEVDASIQAASADGQDVFKLVDALGLPGQRGLAGIARQPGDTARQEISDFLMARQSGQADRLSSFIGEALDAPDTAAAREVAMKAARKTAADTAYEAARGNASPVDVRGALAVIDARTGGMGGSGIAGDAIDGKLTGYRSRLSGDGKGLGQGVTGAELSDFDRVLGVKQAVQDDIGAAIRAGRNNEARELGKLVDELDAALEGASDMYRTANDQFAKASKEIGAIDAGKDAVSGRVRSEDTAAAWAKMTQEEQAAFRVGYADPVIAKIDHSALGVNKARPFTGTKTAKDMMFMAKDPAKVARQIERENRMFETNVAALGGSKTSDNLADIEDMTGISNSVIGNLMSGNFLTAGRQVADKFAAAATGSNPATREIIARALMSTDTKAALAPAIAKAAKTEPVRNVIEALIRSGAVRAQ